MASFDDDDDLQEEGDYYATLGIDKTATKEEINNAFRRYSKLYHPDKHQSQEKKSKADALFNKIKTAHEVLSDPQKKAIYDASGPKGLKFEGWQLQTKQKTPQEILEEFERLKNEKEEKLLSQRTNPKGSLTIGIDATDIFERYEPQDRYYSSTFPSVEINNMSMSQSIECPLTTTEVVTLSGQLSSHNGTGHGNATAGVRKIFNQSTWGEADLTLGSDPSLSLRGFRSIWAGGQVMAGCSFQSLPDGNIGIVYSLVSTRQLSKNLHGRLNFTAGLVSGVNTTAIYQKECHRVVIGCQLGIPASYVLFHYSYVFKDSDSKLKTALRLGTNGVVFEYGFEKKITKFSRLGGSIVVGVPHGVSLKIRLSRGSQTFYVPVRLSEDVLPSSILYGTLVPLLTFALVKKFVVDPFVTERTEKDLKEKKSKHAELFEKKKQEAASALDLMSESIERSYEVERGRAGLVIVGALYGKNSDDPSGCIEVSRCLQSLVKDSKLVVSENIKLFDLPGFYDPCFGECKQLRVEYDFDDRRHVHLFADGDRIVLPNADHLLR